MPIQNIKIVPSFPDSVRKSVSGAGGRMLGQKMAIEQIGRARTQDSMDRRAGANLTLGYDKLNQRADIANQKLSLQKQKSDEAMKKLTIEGAKFYRGLYNKYTSEKAKENAAMIKKYRDPAPIKSWTQWMGEEQGIDVAGLGVKDFNMQPAQQENPRNYMETMYQDRGGDAAATKMLRAASVNMIPPSNRGPAIRGYAEGGVITNPQLAMVGEGGGKEFIVPENKVSPEMAAKLQQVVGGQQGQQAPTREGLAQLMGQVPEPQKMVSDRLPKLEQLIEQLDTYENAEDALSDLLELDRGLMDIGMDLADVQGIEQFVAAYAKKFGDIAAQQLMQEAVSRRGQ